MNDSQLTLGFDMTNLLFVYIELSLIFVKVCIFQVKQWTSWSVQSIGLKLLKIA